MIHRWWAALRRRRPAAAEPVPVPPARRLEPESARVRADIAILRAELRLQLPRETPREPQREDAAR